MSEDKKIKRIIYCDTPLDFPGGGQISLRLVLEHLAKEKYEPLVFMPGENLGIKWFEENKIPFKIVPPKKLFTEIKKFNPDLIHCNSAATRYTFYTALVAKILNIPFVWHVRVTESAGWRDKLIACLSKKILVISEAVKERFPQLKKRAKVKRIYNAVDQKKFKPQIPVDDLYGEFSIENKGKIIGFFSRIEPLKGCELFLKAAKIVKEKRAKVAFLITGDGEEDYKQKFFTQIKELGLEGRVIFTGPRHDIHKLLNLCDLVISPSLFKEGFSRIIIEAMACGVPVVATGRGGPREIIENGRDGFLVSAEPQELAVYSLRLLEDEDLRKEFIQNALKKVKEKFAVEQHIKELENLYEEILTK